MLTWIALTTGSLGVITLLFFVVKKLVQALKVKQPAFAQDQFIVKFNDNVDEDTIASIHKKYKCEASCCNETLGFQVVTTAKNINKMMKIYSELDEVEYAEANYVFEASYIPNDPFYSFQYGPQKVSAPSAWDVTQSNAGIRIAILDTGVQPNHPDLASKLVPGYNFIDNNTDTNDFNGHGTHVAGIAAATTNNGAGIAGMAPLASIQPVKVLSNSGSGLLSQVADGIIYAVNQGVQVINLSLGSPQDTITLEGAVNYAASQGVVVIGAAGNNGSNALTYPAAYANVIAVASTTSSDQRSVFSNFGTWVQVAAPGSSILSTYPTSTYSYLSGTSMAAPHVAGLAALLAAQGRSASQIRTVIQNTCDPIIGTGTNWVYGRINADRAVRSPL
ncbi:S8 family peptidase [Priestia flexa]|uniref:S8 family peptidase n=1 Tax=Priestia flexa TaxID=86664 RepID=A0ABU4JAS4_9BACI|nr:S8 family peptidase [Priestia flexa]MBY6087189.1 S8 family peptidase [Priestia flexa]MCA1203359.1 S8 family peptidase [Priestia flexa]MDW8518103.1 S8 family peptidase [Priestia flexa]WEZ06528.1 S8 family peptidase [Priestia flexa]WHX77808.1 S8 family peptidase [Priestia flexa]